MLVLYCLKPSDQKGSRKRDSEAWSSPQVKTPAVYSDGVHMIPKVYDDLFLEICGFLVTF